jgi:retinol dehydrogenase 12
MAIQISPNIAFGGQTTDQEVAAVYGSYARGKTIIVTGANCGLGLETSRCLAAHGATVILMSRSTANGEKAVAEIKAEYPDADVSTMALDLGSLASVRSAAKAYLDSGRPLHILINNAGVMVSAARLCTRDPLLSTWMVGLQACPRALTADGFESQIGVNHLGHFLFTTLLLPALAKSGTAEQPARVINLSSMGNWLFAPPQGIDLDDLDATK